MYFTDLSHSIESTMSDDPEDSYTFESRWATLPDKDMELTHLIVHTVRCKRSRTDGQDHSDHDELADYFDVPRLFAGDTRASALRGKKRFRDVEEYCDDHPEIQVVVMREYSCNKYHSDLKDRFELSSAGIERQVHARLRPWLYRLPSLGPLADKYSERIRISNNLSSTIAKLVLESQPLLGQWNPRINLQEPYDYFYHFRKSLRQQSPLNLRKIAHKELNALLDYIDESHGAIFDKVDNAFASGNIPKDLFSKLFAPNEVIVTSVDGHPRAYIAEKVAVIQEGSKPNDKQSINMECWAWKFDGSFQKMFERLTVSWPSSDPATVSLESLPIQPLRLDKSKLSETLLKRGREFWSCRHRKLVSYDAPAPTIFELQITNPKYMIDYRTYRQMHPSKFQQPMASEAEMKEQGIDMSNEEPPNDLFCILLSPTMVGYAFHDKKWRSLSMDHIGPVPWNKEAFNRLVLKSKKRETIKALVTVHLKTVQNVDVVENKGNGLIILLHGSPGTGKTLTAESVAEFAEKPLYRVTCGDVGTDAESVEKYMESVLLIGTIWGCVVLLDEADVFLEERQVTDLARNALVSVFLRVLEYYDGILILTTNRVGTFDEAFKSRIQLAVHYPALDEEGRYEIWLNFINAMKEKKVDMNFEELIRKARVLARISFNGRQIRNNLWTAAQVAKYKNEQLQYSHLEQVVEISQEFEEYLDKTRGHTDEENAIAQGIRSS